MAVLLAYCLSILALVLFFRCTKYNQEVCTLIFEQNERSLYNSLENALEKANRKQFVELGRSTSILSSIYVSVLYSKYILNPKGFAKIKPYFIENDFKLRDLMSGLRMKVDIVNHIIIMNILGVSLVCCLIFN